MSTCTDTDKVHLARAIELASRGLGAVKPNPVVGAVVARDGETLGEGWHEEFGGLHAEVNAIEACGLEDLTGATLYVSLEPCCHEGKTPPCTEAILQAGISRVVVASDDPTEKASGRGLGILRDEGVEVVLADGELAASARLLNQAFRKHARVGRPWVLFKSAMTLDGKVATRTGDSKWISRRGQPRAGPSLARLGRRGRRRHRHRARGRPAADGAPGRPARPARRPAAPGGVRLARAPAAHLPARRGGRRDPAHRGRLAGGGARRHRRAGGRRRAGARGHRRKRARAGALGARPARRARTSPRCCWRAVRTSPAHSSTPDEIDEIRLFLAPLLLGGSAARDPLEGKGVERISEALRALTFDSESVGEDLLISARLREW